jgi:hypothetical protein
MRKVSIILAASVLTLQNSGARAQSALTDAAHVMPPLSFVPLLVLAGMACLLLLAHAPLTTPNSQTGTKTNWSRRSVPSFWPSQRATFAILAVVTVGGALGLA